MSNHPRHLLAALLLAATSSGGLNAQNPAARPTPSTAPRVQNVADVWNFTVTRGEDEVDGFRSPLLIFKRNEGRIGVVPPDGWNSVGGTSELVLVNPALPSARLSLRKSGMPIPKEFDEEWSNTIRDLLLGAVPKAAKNGKVTALKKQPFNLVGWKTFEGRLTFDLAGDKYVWSYIFLRIHELSMIEAITVSRESDFPKAAAASMALLPSWREIREQRTQK